MFTPLRHFVEQVVGAHGKKVVSTSASGGTNRRHERRAEDLVVAPLRSSSSTPRRTSADLLPRETAVALRDENGTEISRTEPYCFYI